MTRVREMLNSDLKAAFRELLKAETIYLITKRDLTPADKARLGEMRAEMKRRDLHLEEHMPRDRWPRKGV